MIIFDKATFQNFLGFGEIPVEFELNTEMTTLICGHNGAGKANSVDSMIKTPTGWIRMGDIEIGTDLQMPDGSIAPVSGVYPQGEMDLYRVTFQDGRSTEVTLDHLWSAKCHQRGNKYETLTTQQIIDQLELKNNTNNGGKNCLTLSVPLIKKECFDHASNNLPLDPYYLGLLLGDGGFTDDTVKFSSADEYLISKITESAKNINDYVKYSDQYDYRINGTNTKRALVDLGLYGLYSHEKFVPHLYLSTSYEDRLAMIQGLMDSDGTVGKNQGMTFTSTSKQLSEDFQYLIRSIGGTAKIDQRYTYYKHNGIKKRGKLSYRVTINFHSRRDLVQLPRKMDRLTETTQYSNNQLSIISVEFSRRGDAQCIMVNHPDHLYITDDFIVTHNTTILNGIVYTLYGKALSNGAGRVDDLINNINKKRMLTTLEFRKDGEQYKILRGRKMVTGAAGNYVTIYRGEEDITPDSANNANKLIESIMGMPYDLFIRIVTISATYEPFLSLPVSHSTKACQTAIIEELFDLTSLSEKAEILKGQIKDTKKSLEIHHARREALQEERERHEKQLTSAERRMKEWNEDTKNELSELSELLKHAKSIDVENERSVFDEIKNLEAELSELSPTRKDIRNLLKSHKELKENTEAEMSHLKDGNCPYCKQSMEVAKEKLSSAKKTLKTCDRSITDLEEQIATLTSTIDNVNEKIESLESKTSVNTVEELFKVESKIEKYASKIEELNKQENPHMETLEELLDVNASDFDMESINDLEDLLKHQNMVLKLLTKKDSFVRKNLINKNIPFLNKRLNHYLYELNLPQTIEFKHDMTATVSKFGRSLDFGNLSNGQKARVNLAMSFAFRDVLQNLHGQINICMLDEVLDIGLDAEGVDISSNMLINKGLTEGLSVFVISHKEELYSTFDRIIKVELVDDFTTITYPEN